MEVNEHRQRPIPKEHYVDAVNKMEKNRASYVHLMELKDRSTYSPRTVACATRPRTNVPTTLSQHKSDHALQFGCGSPLDPAAGRLQQNHSLWSVTCQLMAEKVGLYGRNAASVHDCLDVASTRVNNSQRNIRTKQRLRQTQW